jgi:acetolactate synthase-1/2/3 large subunit
MYKETHQWIDTVAAFQPVTKWNIRAQLPGKLAEDIREAFNIAQAERPGATHIELPMDVLDKEVSGAPVKINKVASTVPGTPAIREALRIIAQARYPVIIVGGGVIRRGVSKQLVEMAEKLQIPVTQTFMGIGAIDSHNPLSLLNMNLSAHDWVMYGMDRADTVITIGYEAIDCSPRFWNSDKGKRIIHIGNLPPVTDEYYVPELEIVADIGKTLSALTEAGQTRKNWLAGGTFRKEVLEELDRYGTDTAFPMKPQKVIADLRYALEEDDILVSDVGAHKLWLGRMYPVRKPNTLIISNGFAPVGFAVPAAIATKLVYPQRNVVAIVGDGGFLMNSQELETAKRQGISFVTVVWVDSSFGLIEWKQMNKFGHSFGVRFGNHDFKKYAESLGLPGYRVNNAGDFLPVLHRAFAEKLPSIIAVPIAYGENHRLLEKIAGAG